MCYATRETSLTERLAAYQNTATTVGERMVFWIYSSRSVYLHYTSFRGLCCSLECHLPCQMDISLLDYTAGKMQRCNVLLEQAVLLSHHITFTWECAIFLIIACNLHSQTPSSTNTQLPCIHSHMQICIQSILWILVECCSLQINRDTNFDSSVWESFKPI